MIGKEHMTKESILFHREDIILTPRATRIAK